MIPREAQRAAERGLWWRWLGPGQAGRWQCVPGAVLGVVGAVGALVRSGSGRLSDRVQDRARATRAADAVEIAAETFQKFFQNGY